MVDHFYSVQIKRSNDLKIKVQPFCAHPSKACGVQVVKKNSHCGAYPLEKKKYVNSKMAADMAAIFIKNYTSSLMLSPMVSTLPCTACHRQAVELSKSREDLCVITLSCKKSKVDQSI